MYTHGEMSNLLLWILATHQCMVLMCQCWWCLYLEQSLLVIVCWIVCWPRKNNITKESESHYIKIIAKFKWRDLSNVKQINTKCQMIPQIQK
jgi:hypothetical protein